MRDNIKEKDKSPRIGKSHTQKKVF